MLRPDISIALVGEAGQGIQSIETILVSLARAKGYHVYATKEYMSRVRGGINSTSVRISTSPVDALADRVDIAIPLLPAGLPYLKKRLTKNTALIVDGSLFPQKTRAMIDIPLAAIASEVGGAIYANTIAAGVVCAIIGVDESAAESFVADRFAQKGEAVVARNKLAIKRGFDAGREIDLSFRLARPSKKKSGNITLAGADAVALGALAGGCDYVCGYPMSPSTGVLERLAAYSQRHDIIAEQVEDEIGVINMALGAWYAGARALITTSGGGFALMCEGLSLAGMIESPLVAHLAQRPGPATGLPTRTEQGDLNLALYAGHGDFPRIILAPGTLEEGFTLTQRAFDLADRYQVPVLILTDQYFVDTYYDTKRFKPAAMGDRRSIVETDASYKRYSVTRNGVSPRGIPGFGKGIVCVDSDEHDESGYIVEDAEARVLMADKRMRKARAINKAAIKPTYIGGKDAENLVVTWGSTFTIAREALAALGRRDTALLHFPWLHPFPIGAAKTLRGAKRVIVAENNMTGQFADLITRETSLPISSRILKYDGRPFSVEELADAVARELDTHEAAQRRPPKRGA
ncbi:2-oxoacid:acceptor oxidoreductase subunit alpha [bacterium]|nr:2-oxoacid:acceptor oxidoreductase subunit alpha [bacterium]